MRAFATPTYGAPEVLTKVERPAPTPGPRELLVDVEAAAVTRGDDRLRGAEFPGATALIGRAIFGVLRPRQSVQGCMFAGTVSAMGPGVQGYAVGDRVFGEVTHGAYAEQLVIREDAGVARIPSGLSATEVAALPYGAVSAWVFLNDIAQLRPQQHVVVFGAGGGVGRYAVQVARYLGAQVTAVAGPRHHAMLKQLGIGLPAAGSEHRVVEDLSQLGKRADVVLDTSGTTQLADWRAHLSPTGRFVTTDLSMGLLVDLMLAPLRPGPTTHFGVGEVTADNLSQVAALLEAGAIQPVVDRSFAFDDLAAAHRCVHDERPSGDVVVEVQPQTRSTAAQSA